MVTSVAEKAGQVGLFIKEGHLLPLNKTSVELLANTTPAWLLLHQYTLNFSQNGHQHTPSCASVHTLRSQTENDTLKLSGQSWPMN